MKKQQKSLLMSKLFQKYPIEIPDSMREKLYQIIDKIKEETTTPKTRYNIPKNQIDYIVFLYFFEILNYLRKDKNIFVSNFGKFSFDIKNILKNINGDIKIIQEKVPKVTFSRWKRRLNKALNGEEKYKKIYENNSKNTENINEMNKKHKKSDIFRDYLDLDI